MTEQETKLLPLLEAVDAEDITKINRLIDNGEDINAVGKFGFTALHYAAKWNKPKAATCLIERKATIDMASKMGTPLQVAVLMKQTEVALVLINAGANTEVKNFENEMPLHIAAGFGLTEIADALIKAGANVFARSKWGYTPLDIAIAQHGKDSEIACILRKAMEKQGG